MVPLPPGSQHNGQRRKPKARDLPVLLAAAYIVPQFLYAEGIVPSRAMFEELEEQAQGFIDDAAAAIREVAPRWSSCSSSMKVAPFHAAELSRGSGAWWSLVARGLGGIAGALLGSVSASLVGHARLPGGGAADDMDLAAEHNRIVVGADGSPVSALAVQTAYQEADAHGWELVAVNAWLDRAVAFFVGRYRTCPTWIGSRLRRSSGRWCGGAGEVRRRLREHYPADCYPAGVAGDGAGGGRQGYCTHDRRGLAWSGWFYRHVVGFHVAGAAAAVFPP
ncbi:MAG: hypothetical protein U1U88_001554 [Lawsonella clevelandensis]